MVTVYFIDEDLDWSISSSLEVALKVSWGLLLLCKCHTIPRFNSQHLCTYVGYLYNYEQALKKFNSILNVSFMHSRRGEKQNRVLLILKCQSLRYYWEVSVWIMYMVFMSRVRSFSSILWGRLFHHKQVHYSTIPFLKNLHFSLKLLVAKFA